MADITWIKLNVDMFDNRKIKQIRKLPGGNDIVLFWVMLLTSAGRSNAQGYILLTDMIPYTPEALAIEFDMSLDTVKLALEVFKRYNMIEIQERAIRVKNWEEYQSVEGMERVKEQTRLRVAKYRSRKKLDSGSNVTSNATVTQCNGTDIDKDIDIELDKKESIEKKDDTLSPQAIELCKYYETLKPGQSIMAQVDQMKILIDMYGFDWCKEALQITIAKKNKFIQPYMEAILKDWQTNGKEDADGANKRDNAKDTKDDGGVIYDFSKYGG